MSKVSANWQKIPARDYAARYGFRESAVVRRIQAGVYDGVREGDIWYVLRRGINESPLASEQQAKDEPSTRTRRELPWATEPGPIKGAVRVQQVGTVLMLTALGLLLATPLAEGPLVFLCALGVTALAGGLFYEGIRTGIAEDKFGHKSSYSERPIIYSVLITAWFTMTILGLVLIVFAVLE